MALLAHATRKKKRVRRLVVGGGNGNGGAAELIGSNQDLVLEILYRLPITSLLNFKVVCKSWRSLISHPLFPHRYSIRNPPPDSIASSPSDTCFLFAPDASRHGYDFAPLPINHHSLAPPKLLNPSYFSLGQKGLGILHSCNGLLLCIQCDHRMDKLFVCNPIITDDLVHVGNASESLIAFGLVFHPSKSPHYRVVLIENIPKAQDQAQSKAAAAAGGVDARINTYSFRTRKWRHSNLTSQKLLPHCSPSSFSASYGEVVLWEGVLHWASSSHASTLSMDVERECFWSTPRADGQSWVVLRIAVSQGRLKLVETKHLVSERLRILEMASSEDKKQQQRWLVKHYIHLGRVLEPRPEGRICFLHLLKGNGDGNNGGKRRESGEKEEEEEEELLLRVGGKIISYGITSGICKEVCQVYPPSSLFGSVHPCSYTLSSARPPAHQLSG